MIIQFPRKPDQWRTQINLGGSNPQQLDHEAGMRTARLSDARNSKSKQQTARKTRVPFLRASYFVWVIVPVMAYGIYLAFGLPHVIFSYSWNAPHGASYGDYDQRYYTRCIFVGPYGAFTTHWPDNGRCGWIRWEKRPASDGGASQ